MHLLNFLSEKVLTSLELLTKHYLNQAETGIIRHEVLEVKMLTEREGFQLEVFCGTIENLVPQDHFLRKLQSAVDFSFIYDEVRDLYCGNNGRPSIDPVVLVKYLLLGYLNNIESERRIEQEIRVNMAYKWFLGLNITDDVPDHSTISQNRRRRFNGENIYRKLFERILTTCIEKGMVDGKLVLTDSTHVRANASRQSEVKVMVEKESAWYMDRLDKYETTERERLEKEYGIQSPRHKEQPVKPEMKTKIISATDPEAGFLRRPNKPLGMHYLDHQSIDAKHGIIVDVAVTPGNVTDGTPYLDRIKYMQKFGLPIEAVGVDSAYDISLVHQELSENNIAIYTPENNEKPVCKTELRKEDFQYDEKKDAFICPAGNQLVLNRLQRSDWNVSREYKAKFHDCKSCSQQNKCLAPSQKSRRIMVNIFDAAMRHSHKKDGTSEHKRVLALRQVWCEGTFAAQKARHNLKRIHRRGLKAAEEHCLLSAIAVNLKRMVKYMGKASSYCYSRGALILKRITISAYSSLSLKMSALSTAPN